MDDQTNTTTNPTQYNGRPRRDSNGHFANANVASNRYSDTVSEGVGVPNITCPLSVTKDKERTKKQRTHTDYKFLRGLEF